MVFLLCDLFQQVLVQSSEELCGQGYIDMREEYFLIDALLQEADDVLFGGNEHHFLVRLKQSGVVFHQVVQERQRL